ncbi:uncharacterized protein LOC132947709 [Metopolophium dirhodum]|uniref:uncharacterized protein LOC132947709 n=1 Tax=Metopolophium dirhodum TaxID=44670 RepID=UPI00298FB933|nr:uncharacterized protein LOC132947709 [Metopolophium dirhodum]
MKSKLCFRISLLCCGLSNSQSGRFQVTSFQNSSGLYFEAMGPLRISYTNWDFITYVNLTTYYMKYQILQKFHYQTGDVCIQLKKREDSILTSACTDFIQSTFPFMQEIESNFNSVIRILGSNHRTSEHPNRQPRGLINAKNIEDLAHSEDKHVHLSQEQIRIVSSVMNNVNSTMHELLADDQKLQKNINKIEEQSRRSVATINILEIQNTSLEHTAILTVFLNQFPWKTQNLQSIVNSALNGLMHTNVYPPSQLIHELKQIQLTLPSTLELPITESHLSIPELFRTSKLSVVYIQQNLVFVTRGHNKSSQTLNTLECYHPSLDRWSPVTKMSVCRDGVGVGVLDGVLYAVSGKDGSKTLSSVKAYRPSTGVWSTILDMLKPQR